MVTQLSYFWIQVAIFRLSTKWLGRGLGVQNWKKRLKLPKRFKSGKRLKFKGEFNCSVSLGSKTFSSKVSVVPGINSCIFEIDWIVLFDLWELPINSFCNCVSAGLSPAELMFARKIRSVFDRILPNTNKTTATRENPSTRFYKPGDKILFLNYRTGKSFWEEGIIMKRIGHVLYSVRSSKFDCRRHINQLRPRYTDDYKQAEDNELPLEVLYDSFNVPLPITQPTPRVVSSTPGPRVPVSSPIPPPQTMLRRKSTTVKRKVNRLSPRPKNKRY